MKTLAQLKTFEGACKVLGLDPKRVTRGLPRFTAFPKRDQKTMLAHAKLIIVIRAANFIANGGKEWKPDWNNGKWDKFYAWFWMDGGSSGFRFGGYAFWHSRSVVGSRLCFISREACEHVAKQPKFFKLYKEYFVIE